MEIIEKLLKSNAKFVDKRAADYEGLESGQKPQITLVYCSDSRVDDESCCDDTVNYEFSIENMGNQIYTAEGTVDFGVLHLETPMLVILGHTNCGAVMASLTDYSSETEGIKRELNSLVKGFKSLRVDFDETDPLRAIKFAERNVDYQVQEALKKYDSLVKSGSLSVIGMMFDFTTAYGGKRGEIYITNINGETDVNMLKKDELLGGINSTTIDDKVKRLS